MGVEGSEHRVWVGGEGGEDGKRCEGVAMAQDVVEADECVDVDKLELLECKEGGEGLAPPYGIAGDG